MRILSNQETKNIKRYKIKKYRLQDQIFLAEGTKLVTELTSAKLKIKDIIISEEYKENNSLDSFKNYDLIICTNQQFSKISSQANPDGILAVCEIPKSSFELVPNEWVIALDMVQDPGNLGTIIRVADWFGIHKILCSIGTVDAYNPKVIQSTMGSISRVNIEYCNLKERLSNYNGTTYVAVLEGESIYEIENPTPGVIIIGNESNGISEDILKLENKKITIPKKGKAESLNASIALSIIVSHFIRS